MISYAQDKLNQLREMALSDTSEENEPLTPDPKSPMESYFLLNPKDMENYLNFKAVSTEKLTDWDPVRPFTFKNFNLIFCM